MCGIDDIGCNCCGFDQAVSSVYTTDTRQSNRNSSNMLNTSNPKHPQLKAAPNKRQTP